MKMVSKWELKRVNYTKREKIDPIGQNWVGPLPGSHTWVRSCWPRTQVGQLPMLGRTGHVFGSSLEGRTVSQPNNGCAPKYVIEDDD